uniref:Autophagy-related protein n=1 Tax=viral metagenome TaxID=1070528 RepID=A0A6C0AYG9_9ZZZZ
MNCFKRAPSITYDFVSGNTPEERKKYSETLKNKYPDRVPIIIKSNGKNVPEMDKERYLMPKNLKMSDLVYIIRKKIILDEKHALFVFVNNCLVPMNNTIEEIYNQYHSEDNFLYVIYGTENTFG